MTTVNSMFEIFSIYKHSTVIIGTQSLIMGITLLLIALSLKHSRINGKLGLYFLAIAMFMLSVVNFAEYFVVGDVTESYSLAIVIFCASIQMFLLFFAYMSMLNHKFANRSRVLTEIALIVLFTVPALLVLPSGDPGVFNVLFGIGVCYYISKLIVNFYIYRKQIREIAAHIEDYHSYDGGLLLRWVNNTFYLVLVIGVVSVIIPLTNIYILTLYSFFVFSAYLYLYISVIRNIGVFDQRMDAMESCEQDQDQSDDVLLLEKNSSRSDSFISSRQKFLDEWIEARGYAVVGVTANEVAAKLNTNRSRLSLYLKNDLHTNYYQWIASMRIDDAKRQLIEHPDRAISEIAINVGIEDRDNFRRVFNRIVGMSPSVYRKKYFEQNIG